jgi:hypothetical protein
MVSAITPAHFQLFATTASSPIKWRLLSGNNRELGRAVDTYTDAESCLVAVKQFVEGIDELAGLVRRRDGGGWGWWLASETGIVVTCGRSYDRQIRCEQALLNFRVLAAGADTSTGLVVTASRRWAHSSQGTRPMTLNLGVDRPRRARPKSGQT